MNTVIINAFPGSSVIVGDLPADIEAAEAPVQATALRQEDVNPITSEQRRALFGLWADTFGGQRNRHDRHLFTAAVLGADVDPSWSGTNLTAAQADRLLTVLGVVAKLV